MGLTQTRPEKAEAMSRLVYALRNAIAESVQKDGLNIAEAICTRRAARPLKN